MIWQFYQIAQVSVINLMTSLQLVFYYCVLFDLLRNVTCINLMWCCTLIIPCGADELVV